MLRIHFTSDDLTRVRFAATPDPMWEIVLSAQILATRDGEFALRRWRTWARERIGEWLRPLMVLTAPTAYFPDFLTPDVGTCDVEQGIEMVMTTPRARLARELEATAAFRRLPAWCGRLAAGDAATTTRLGDALRTYTRTLLQPHWPVIRAQVDADRARRSRIFLDSGFHGVLGSLGPAIRWRPPVLETDYPVERDLRLDGRGLLLVPSYFCWQRPVALGASDLRPTLVYPIDHDVPVQLDGSGQTSQRPLAALIGTTRAAILRAIEDGCTTSELACRSNTTLSSASQHATVLRNAGLVTTQRYGGAVLHSLTPLGLALLNGAP